VNESVVLHILHFALYDDRQEPSGLGYADGSCFFTIKKDHENHGLHQ